MKSYKVIIFLVIIGITTLLGSCTEDMGPIDKTMVIRPSFIMPIGSASIPISDFVDIPNEDELVNEGLIAAGYDPDEVSKRVKDSVKTALLDQAQDWAYKSNVIDDFTDIDLSYVDLNTMIGEDIDMVDSVTQGVTTLFFDVVNKLPFSFDMQLAFTDEEEQVIECLNNVVQIVDGISEANNIIHIKAPTSTNPQDSVITSFEILLKDKGDVTALSECANIKYTITMSSDFTNLYDDKYHDATITLRLGIQTAIDAYISPEF